VGVPVVLVGVGPGREQIIWADAAKDSAMAADAIAATKA
jgi:adenylosuccinate synthase